MIFISETTFNYINDQSSQTGSQSMMEEQPTYGSSRRSSASSKPNDGVEQYPLDNKLYGTQPNFNPTVVRKRSPVKYNVLERTPSISRKTSPSNQQTNEDTRKLSKTKCNVSGVTPSQEEPTTNKKAPAMSSHQKYFNQYVSAKLQSLKTLQLCF